jgi:hypothetical protein
MCALHLRKRRHAQKWVRSTDDGSSASAHDATTLDDAVRTRSTIHPVFLASSG